MQKSHCVKETNRALFLKRIIKYREMYLLFLIPFVYLIIFKYVPILGNVLAFRKYSASAPLFGTRWMGLTYFKMLFEDVNFYNRFLNTVVLSIENLVIGFPIPIIFALLVNEIKNKNAKKFIQTVSYLPHFISIVVVVGFINKLLSPNAGAINMLRLNLGMNSINYIAKPEWFRTIYIVSEIWQNMGWNAIIYIAALSSVDSQLYEAAMIDGAGRWKQTVHVTIPGIMPTIVITLIMSVGSMLAIGYEMVLLLMNNLNKETADIISTYVYRLGIVDSNYSYSTAVGLFNAVVGLILVCSANYVCRKVSDTSLW